MNGKYQASHCLLELQLPQASDTVGGNSHRDGERRDALPPGQKLYSLVYRLHQILMTLLVERHGQTLREDMEINCFPSCNHSPVIPSDWTKLEARGQQSLQMRFTELAPYGTEKSVEEWQVGLGGLHKMSRIYKPNVQNIYPGYASV